MIYLIVLVFLFIPVLIFDFFGKTNNWKPWYYAELIVLILLVGLRYRVGGDTLNYIDYFDEYPTFSDLFNFDFYNARFNPLWYVYNAIIKSIWDDFTFFQLVQATIVNCVFFWFFKKHTKYFFSAIFIYYVAYYLYFNMEILREILPVCIFMMSLGLLQKKKYTKYFICAILAMLFHYSAMIMFVVPLLMLIPKISWKTTTIMFFLLIILLNVLDLSPFISQLLIGSETLSGKFDAYSSMNDYTLNIRGVIAYSLPIILLMYANRNNEQDDLDGKIQNLLFLYILLIGFTIFFPAMFSRLQNYIAPFYIIYIINTTIKTIKDKINKTFLQSLTMRFVLIWFLLICFKSYTVDCSEYMLGAKSYNIYYPYHSVFDPVMEVEREKFIDMYKSGNED